jgi:hypothetical protein
MDNQYYIRIRGRVLGPYDMEKLQALVRRGQLSRIHEISGDGVNWLPAPTLPGLFTPELPQSPRNPRQSSVGGRPPLPHRSEQSPPSSDNLETQNRNKFFLIPRSLLYASLGLLGVAVIVIAGIFIFSSHRSDKNYGDMGQTSTTDESSSLDGEEDDSKTVKDKEDPVLPAFLPGVHGDITSIKDQNGIRSALGLVVVGLDIRQGKEHYECPIGSGSAFAVGSNDGTMLTNRHVVDWFYEKSRDGNWKKEAREKGGVILSEKMWVFLSGKKYSASLLFVSPKYDFAIIQIPFHSKKSFRMKRSTDNLIAEDIHAIGFPGIASAELSEEQKSDNLAHIEESIKQGQGIAIPDTGICFLKDVKEFFLSHKFQFVLTKGAVCQVARDDVGKTSWLQHTANIAPGNSGGPLVLSDGTVVGINTIIVGNPGELGAQFYRALTIDQLKADIDRFVKGAKWVP